MSGMSTPVKNKRNGTPIKTIEKIRDITHPIIQTAVVSPMKNGMPNIAKPAFGLPAIIEPKPVIPVQPADIATIIANTLRNVEIPVTRASSSLTVVLMFFMRVVNLAMKPAVFCRTPHFGHISAFVFIIWPHDTQYASSNPLTKLDVCSLIQ